ncbi:MAG: hypothetical protein ABIP97_06105 [Chthoniobacterales bacterium]
MNKEGHLEKPGRYIIIGLICGLAGLLFWLIPPLGFPTSLLGLFFAGSAIKSARKKIAIFATILCALGVLLSVANVGIGIYVYTTGKPKVLKEWLDHALAEGEKQRVHTPQRQK